MFDNLFWGLLYCPATNKIHSIGVLFYQGEQVIKRIFEMSQKLDVNQVFLPR